MHLQIKFYSLFYEKFFNIDNDKPITFDNYTFIKYNQITRLNS